MCACNRQQFATWIKGNLVNLELDVWSMQGLERGVSSIGPVATKNVLYMSCAKLG